MNHQRKNLRSIGTVVTVQYTSLRRIIKLQDTFMLCPGSICFHADSDLAF
jgi:hypothetical protein